MTVQAVQIVDHAYVPWTSSSGWEACIHLDGRTGCGRPPAEHEDVPVSVNSRKDATEAGA